MIYMNRYNTTSHPSRIQFDWLSRCLTETLGPFKTPSKSFKAVPATCTQHGISKGAWTSRTYIIMLGIFQNTNDCTDTRLHILPFKTLISPINLHILQARAFIQHCSIRGSPTVYGQRSEFPPSKRFISLGCFTPSNLFVSRSPGTVPSHHIKNVSF